MTKSIVFSYPGAEVATINNWSEFSELTRAEQLVAGLYLKDPVKDARFPFDVVAVFGFLETADKGHLVYFWSRELISYAKHNPEHMARLETLVGFGSELSTLWKNEPSFVTAVGVCKASNPSWLTDLKGKVDLFWKKNEDLTFCAIIGLQGTAEDGYISPPNDDIDDCLSFHCDYFCAKSPVWSTIPLRFLLDKSKNANETALGILIHPRQYSPFSHEKSEYFQWPWQACIKRVDDTLQQTTVKTTSLVFDLRKSTLAMEAADDIATYSPFIELVVSVARECIFQYGGYFDKETGDGIVAHFADFDGLWLDSPIEPAQKRALDSAVALLRRITELCEEFQSGLDDWIDNLGGAVGLHYGNAVWSIRDGKAQAIGSSVVKAARLCAEAKVEHIFVSNAFFNGISDKVRAETLSKFERTSYVGKEYGGIPQKSGFTINFKEVHL